MQKMEMTSQEFANKIGVSLSTIYSWENKGLIKPARKTLSGRRFYSEEQVQAYLNGDYENPILKGKKEE